MLVLVVATLVSERVGGGEKDVEDRGDVAPDEAKDVLAVAELEDCELVDGLLAGHCATLCSSSLVSKGSTTEPLATATDLALYGK